MSTAATGLPTCYRHPDRETGLSCSECGRSICTECMTPAAVGVRCPDHAGTRKRINAPRVVRRVPQGSTDGLVTKTLIAVNLAVFLITVAQGNGLTPGGAIFHRFSLVGDFVAQGDWWRLITAAF